jgi:hypothetical protein
MVASRRDPGRERGSTTIWPRAGLSWGLPGRAPTVLAYEPEREPKKG